MTEQNTSDRILAAAVALASANGWRSITRDAVAERAGVAMGTVNLNWGTIDALRSAVMREAVIQGLVRIVGAGLAEGHPEAQAAPQDLKRRALAMLL